MWNLGQDTDRWYWQPLPLEPAAIWPGQRGLGRPWLTPSLGGLPTADLRHWACQGWASTPPPSLGAGGGAVLWAPSTPRLGTKDVLSLSGICSQSGSLWRELCLPSRRRFSRGEKPLPVHSCLNTPHSGKGESGSVLTAPPAEANIQRACSL